MNNRHRSKNTGFSLIELMVSLTIGAIIIAAVISLYITNKRSFTETSRYARQQENGRYAITLLEQELRNGGFFGTVSGDNVNTADVTLSGTDCSGKMAAFDLANVLWGTTAGSSTVNACLSDVKVGTDIIVFKGTQGGTVVDGSLDANALYVRANRVTRKLFEGDGSTPSAIDVANATNLNWPFINHVYYIKEVSGIPTFSRLIVSRDSGSNAWKDEPLIAGVEQMRVLYGVDSNGLDGIPDYFDEAAKVNTANHWDKVVAVRIYLLVRGDRDPLYTDSKTYTLGDKSIAVATGDAVHYHRKVWNTGVILRNSWIRNISKLN